MLCVNNMCSFVVSKTKTITLLLASLIGESNTKLFARAKGTCTNFSKFYFWSKALATSEDAHFTATPKDKEVFLGENVQFDWDYLDNLDVKEVRFGVFDAKTGREDAIVKKQGGTLQFNNMDKPIEWIRNRVEVVDGRRASFKINQVQMNDSRTFFCVLIIGLGKSVLNTVKLNVVGKLKLKLYIIAECFFSQRAGI